MRTRTFVALALLFAVAFAGTAFAFADAAPADAAEPHQRRHDDDAADLQRRRHRRLDHHRPLRRDAGRDHRSGGQHPPRQDLPSGADRRGRGAARRERAAGGARTLRVGAELLHEHDGRRPPAREPRLRRDEVGGREPRRRRGDQALPEGRLDPLAVQRRSAARPVRHGDRHDRGLQRHQGARRRGDADRPRDRHLGRARHDVRRPGRLDPRRHGLPVSSATRSRSIAIDFGGIVEDMLQSFRK